MWVEKPHLITISKLLAFPTFYSTFTVTLLFPSVSSTEQEQRNWLKR